MTNNYIRVFAKNAAQLLLLLFLFVSNAMAQPCQPAYTTGTSGGDFISRVLLDSIDNKTGASASPYFTFYNAMSTSLGTGKSYTVKIAPGSYATNNDIAVWIDFNQNDTFETGEKLGQKNSIDSFALDSITFTVPNNATTGKTRMRVREWWNNANMDPCSTGGFGETEDYVIYIDYVACTSPPTAGTIGTAKTSVCDGTAFTLSLMGSTGGAGQTNQWQSSSDTVTWTDISAATNSIYSDTQRTNDIYYRCYIVCSGNADTSAWILMKTSPTSQCYCTPAHATCTGGDIITNVNIVGTCLNQDVSACNSSTPNYYYDFTSGTIPILNPGTKYDLGVTTNTDNIISVWFDFDHSGTFDASEWTQIATTTTANQETLKTISIPAGATHGVTRMRIRSRGTGNPNGSGDACTQFFSGVMHDYNVNIRPPLNADVAAMPLVQPVNAMCYTSTETVEVQIGNSGTDTIDMSANNVHVKVAMTVNANTSTLDSVVTSGKIAPGGVFNVIFNGTLDMSASASTFDFMVKAELSSAPDSNACNDSTVDMRVSVSPISQPYTEDFDFTGSVPANYTSNGYTPTASTGVGGTQSLRASMSSGAQATYFSTELLGPLTNLSTFKFSYRTTSQLPAKDSVGVFVSSDCGKNFSQLFTIKSSNSVGNSYKDVQLNLDQYAGSNVVIGVANFYASGNSYSVDFDNVALGERPVVDLGRDTAICGSITLDANPNSQNWDFLWNNNTTNPVRSFGATGKYWVKATDPSTGIIGIDTVRITVYNLPNVKLGNDISVCPGSSAATLDAGSWPSAYTILWSTGDTTRTITPASSGTYSVMVTTPGACFGADTINLAFSNRPTGASIIQGTPFNGNFNSGSPDEVCVGSTVTYELTPPSGYGNNQFGTKWTIVGNAPLVKTANGNMPSFGSFSVSAPGANNAKMSFTPTKAEGDSTYIIYVTVKDSVTGCDTVVMRSIKVNAPPTINMTDQTVCPGSSATFDAGTFNGYSWNTGATTQTITVSIVAAYTVEVTDAKGCKNAVTVNLNNYTAPTVNLGADKKICPGTSLTLNAGTFNGYSWSTGASTQTISVNAAGDYSVEITDANGCKDVDSINVSLLPKPVSTFSQTISGLSVTFTPTDQALQSYHWYFGDGGQSFTKIPTHPYAAFGNYDVALVAGGTNGCFDSLSQPLALSNGIASIEGLNNVSVFPNPYSEQTTLQIDLSKSAKVSVVLFDAVGRRVATIADRNMAAGNNQLMIDTRSYQAAQGIYNVQITVNGQQMNLRVVDMGGK